MMKLVGELATPVLLYYVAESRTMAFLLLPGETQPLLEVLDLSWGALTGRVRDFTYALADPLLEEGARAGAAALWRDLLAPFSQALPAGGPLVLAPHGPLHQLPFAALRREEDGPPLFERYQISVTPSLSALALVRARHRPPRPGDAMFAFAGGKGLPLTAALIERLSGWFSNKARLARATMHRYRSIAPNVRHLLIATRGVHAPNDPRATYLEIEPTEEHDHRLSADEITTIPLNAELVTLAACDATRGEALLSDERLDLARAFLIAGATAVLATRWKVPEDQRTTAFLDDFYRAYRSGGKAKHEALTEARRAARARGEPALIWAAWTLIGDPR